MDGNPVETELKREFLMSSAKVLSSVGSLLERHGCGSPVADSLDFSPFMPALEALSRRQRWTADGAKELRVVIEVFQAVCEGVRDRKRVSAEILRRGLAGAESLREWLRTVR